MNEYEGNWLMTYTGKKFHFLDPQPDEIDIVDIAHALSLTCRYGGHCKDFYSVAEHCCRVSCLVDERSKLSALLHDAEEAYVPDIPRPIKKVTKDLQDISFVIQEAVLSKYDAFNADWKSIREYDNRILQSEADLLGFDTTDWDDLGTPVPIAHIGWKPKFAEQEFLRLFKEYNEKARNS